ncbi:MAG: hypothetical protein ABIB41_12570 [Nitrospirota bacterium]
MKLRILFLLLMICCSVQIGVAGEILPEKGCKDNSEVVDKCFTIHGRISIYNGTPSVRIWHIGTKRLYGVLPSENEIMPEDVKKYLTFGTSIYGDFLVCPFTKTRSGQMQYVCIESATNLVCEQYLKGKEKPKVFRIKSKCDNDLEEWLKCINPIVTKYLLHLTQNDTGRIVKGVLLTDGTKEMQGYIFLGEAKGLGKGVHLYIFEYKKQRSAYVWIDEGGTELLLPNCPDIPEEDLFESAYVLSGDVYTWAAVQPGDDVVHVMCVKDSWVRKAQ